MPPPTAIRRPTTRERITAPQPTTIRRCFRTREAKPEATLEATARERQPAGRRAGEAVPAGDDGPATDHQFE